MAIQTLKEGLHSAKAETRLVAALLERTDRSQKQIGKDFGVSESFIEQRRDDLQSHTGNADPSRSENNAFAVAGQIVGVVADARMFSARIATSQGYT